MEMYIATPFRRPNSPVSLKNENGTQTQYFFRPCDPQNPNSEHVALVTNPKHIQKLLAIDGGKAYSIAEYQGDSKTSTSGERPQPPVVTAPTPSNVQNTPADLSTTQPQPVAPQMIEGTGPRPNEPQVETANARDAEAVALLDLPLKDFKAALPKTKLLVCAAALAIEDAKGEADKRPTYIKALNDRVKKG